MRGDGSLRIRCRSQDAGLRAGRAAVRGARHDPEARADLGCALPHKGRDADQHRPRRDQFADPRPAAGPADRTLERCGGDLPRDGRFLGCARRGAGPAGHAAGGRIRHLLAPPGGAHEVALADARRPSFGHGDDVAGAAAQTPAGQGALAVRRCRAADPAGPAGLGDRRLRAGTHLVGILHPCGRAVDAGPARQVADQSGRPPPPPHR